MQLIAKYRLFDCHFHIIDPRFPLVENQGFLPECFTCEDYRRRLSHYRLAGGALVSASFQGLDQSYLLDALKNLGPNYVGVTQLSVNTSDQEILNLNRHGIRGVRFNVKRSVNVDLERMEEFAQRIFALAGWHIELYIDSRELDSLTPTLSRLPRVSIAHLGLSQAGLPFLLRLAERGVHVKATGFGRVDFPIEPALKKLYQANPYGLMFGTDLPCTRTSSPYTDADFLLALNCLGEDAAYRIFYANAHNFYRPEGRMNTESVHERDAEDDMKKLSNLHCG